MKHQARSGLVGLFGFRKISPLTTYVRTISIASLTPPCIIRAKSGSPLPGDPLGEQSNETCGQDVIPDGRYDLCIHSACCSGSFVAGRRSADSELHRARVPLRHSMQTLSYP